MNKKGAIGWIFVIIVFGLIFFYAVLDMQEFNEREDRCTNAGYDYYSTGSIFIKEGCKNQSEEYRIARGINWGLIYNENKNDKCSWN